MMNPSFNQESARIYQFPAGGRSGLGALRHDEIKTSADLASRVSVAAGSWYHEAAIQEAKPVRER
jgi:hypothetical protein